MARTPSINHARYGHFSRQRYSKKLLAYLSDTATRLLSSASAQTIVPVAVANVNASSVLTMGTNATAAQTVTINGQVYTFRAALTEAKASGTLTGTATNVANGDTVTINGLVYTFQTVLTNVARNVFIGASAAASLTNLFRAITLTGTPGTDYAAATVINPDVTATNPTGTTLVATAKVIGTAANAFATTETSTQLSWGAATLTGGVNAIANEVFIGAANTNSIDNLVVAINAGAGVGTVYSTGTVANPDVTAGARAGNTTTATSVLAGIGGNGLLVSTTVTAASWAGAFLSGGVAATFGPNVTATAHGYTPDKGPFVITSSNGAGGLPAGYTAGKFLHVDVINANTIRLYTNRELSALQTFTSGGTGTLSLTRVMTAAGVHSLLKRNAASTVSQATDIDNLQ